MRKCIAILFAMCFLAACGQMGSLYLPKGEKQVPQSNQSSGDSSEEANMPATET
ncbi:lipoprotein [Francisellaceae bacterium]|nr:lipoprotein [Francisellaceae bacterium]